MKKLYKYITLLILLLWAEVCITLHAQNFHLVKDINNSKDANPYEGNLSGTYTILNGISYFVADDGIHGSELWRSDGTSAGTHLVKDIYPGPTGSSVFWATVSNNKLFFAADDGNGYQLWVSDGTAENTNILPGAPISFAALTDLNGFLYFFDNSGNLWKSDGTASGTAIVATLSNAVIATYYHMIDVNGVLFFVAYDYTNGLELFRTDGTTAGTYLVKDINTSGDSDPRQLTAVNGKLYFSANDGSGRKLWMSDGTADGTMLAANNNSVTIPYSYDLTLAHTGTALYFSGNTSAGGTELYKFNTINPSVKSVKDIAAGSVSSNPQNITNVNGSVFFSARGSDGKTGLWKSDGTAQGTVPIKNGESTRDYFLDFVNDNGNLYFSYYNQAKGAELWKSDGSTEGTMLIKDIYPGNGSSSPGYLTPVNDQLLFSANDGNTGIELWKSNGTQAGTQLVKDINQTTTSSSSPSYLTAFKHTLFFNAYEQKHGAELWTSDGTRAGTSLATDILPGPLGSYPFDITPQKNNLYFFAYVDTLGLWKMNGINGTPTLVKTLPGNKFVEDFSFGVHATKTLLYFFLYNNDTQALELWRSDGTEQGTYLLKGDFSPLIDGGSMAAVAGDNILIGSLTDTSASLWKSDGTVEGTALVKNFKPGIFYEISNLFPYNGYVFFNADGGNGTALWKSDGTEKGTVVVKNLFRPGLYGYAESNGILYFDADDGISGRQLWKTDGTTAGTKLVKRIAPYDASPQNLTDVNGTLYFTADDYDFNTGIGHGRELYKTDGTKEGTQLVKDITPGFTSTNFPSSFEGKTFTNANGELYFTIYNDSYSALTLWQSDGTEAGTKAVPDKALADLTYVTDLTPVFKQLFFTGYSYQYGWELYAGDAEVPGNQQTSIADALVKSLSNDAFSVKLLTNPIKDELRFIVNVKDQQSAQIMITDASGRTLLSDKQKLSSGTNIFSYSTQSWSQGMYMIRIVTGNGCSSLLKAVK